MRYRWEILLLVVIPFVNRGFSFGLVYTETLSGTGAPSLVSGIAGTAVSNLISLALLAAFFLRVRRQGRPLLTLIWGYAIAQTSLFIPTYLLFLNMEPLRDVTDMSGISAFAINAALWIAVEAAVFVWFVRRASMMGVASALFLLLVLDLSLFSAVLGIDPRVLQLAVDGSTGSLVGALAWVVFFPVNLIGTIVAVWLLRTFESRAPTFQRRVVIALYVYVIIGALMRYLPYFFGFYDFTDGLFLYSLGTLPQLAFILVGIGVVYLVRVRRPQGGTAGHIPASA